MPFIPVLYLIASMIPMVAGSAQPFHTDEVGAGPCTLITRQEAAAALGAAVPAGVEKTMDVPLLGRPVKAQYCFYGTEVSLARYELGGTAATLFTEYRKSLASDDDYQIVTGIGDEAFFAKGQLAVRKGTTGLIIDVGQARGGGPKEQLKEKGLALLAVGRL